MSDLESFEYFEDSDENASEEYSKLPFFEPYGWVHDTSVTIEDMDNPTLIVDYISHSANDFLNNENTQRAAAQLVALTSIYDEKADAIERSEITVEIKKLLVAMFQIGYSSRRLEEESMIPMSRKLDMIQKSIRAQARYSVMQMANAERDKSRKLAKEYVQEYARSKWMDGTWDDVRTGDATEIMWGVMAESAFLKEQMPDTRETVKGWLRVVAKDFPHAQKRGRPKSK